ncbi:MAG: FAD-dependent monooxygenase [Acidobacteriaceae bacterium]
MTAAATESAAKQKDAHVLIVGAGPTGLVLALWLARRGVRIRIVDKAAEAGTTSRALAVQSRTLEFYAQLGLAEEVVARGRWATGADLRAAGKHAAHIDFAGMGAEVSPFHYLLIFPQDEHEKLLVEYLAKAGVEVERATELVNFESTTDGIAARMRKHDGTEETCTASYIAGCDGARSVVRETLGIGFPGGTYEHVFYVADVEAEGPAMNGGLQIALERNEFLAVFPMQGEGRARLIGTVHEGSEQKREQLSWDDVGRKVIQQLRIDVKKVNWFSTYRVHHRVADRFRQGRAFLLGDAAHIHSPVGGQGMNTGIGDAVNLAWKLAAVVNGSATESLLDSYEPERIAFARRLVATTDRAFTGVTSNSALARLIRLHIAPVVVPLMFSLSFMRRLLYRTISQTNVNYRGSSLSEGNVGPVHGGDRLPWTKLDGGKDNFAPLASLDWQAHVYGEARPELRTLCTQRSLPLHVFPWRPEMQRAGLRRNAVYLVRPDGYVALADAEGRAAPIASYLSARNLTITGCGSTGNS